MASPQKSLIKSRDEYIKYMLAQCKKFATPVENRMLAVPTPFQTEGKKDVAAYKVVARRKGIRRFKPCGNTPILSKAACFIETAIATDEIAEGADIA